MKTKKVLIIGTGETADLAYEYFTYDSEYEVCGFCVNRQYLKENQKCGLNITAIEDIEDKYDKEKYHLFVAIASSKLNYDRTKVYNELKNKGWKFASYISSKAFVWHNAQIGENCFILENNTIQPFTKVGNNVTMWSSNHLGHRSVIKDNCFITSHVVISGFCEIGENTFMGVNSTVADNIKIAKDNFIAMSAVVNKNTEENGLYTGNPAKKAGISAKEYFGVL